MRIFLVTADRLAPLDALPDALPTNGYLWLGCGRSAFAEQLPALQAALQRWESGPLLELHVSDLLNKQLPSNFDYTSWYDMLVFRRLAGAGSSTPAPADGVGAAAASARHALQTIDTSPVGFALFDQVLITVHPDDCMVRDYFVQRLLASAAGTGTGTGPGADPRSASRLPTSPADLMLRMVNHIVDGYLELRRRLTRDLGGIQQQLLDPKSRFYDWQVLLESRNALHLLEDICEDQIAAVQEWLDSLEEWPDEPGADKRRERELLRVRTRDVLEHIERVLSHVRRLQQSAETAVQMHFSALGNRTNDIMRTLTVLTAIFLPLNLITGFFGMNFEALPFIHSPTGVWTAIAMMLMIGLGLGLFFWRKRYLGTRKR
jgi:Mg2+ and Co2+ transporter CorA